MKTIWPILAVGVLLLSSRAPARAGGAVGGGGGGGSPIDGGLTTLDDAGESDFIDSGTFGASGINIIPAIPVRTAPVFGADGGMTTDRVVPFELPPEVDPFVQPPPIIGPLDEEPGPIIIIPPPPVVVIPEEDEPVSVIEPPLDPFIPLEFDESDYIDPGTFGIFVPEFIAADPDDESDYIDYGTFQTPDFDPDAESDYIDSGFLGGYTSIESYASRGVEETIAVDPSFYEALDFVDLEFADE